MGQENAVKLIRHENWPLRLSKFLHDCRKKPHQFGMHDCLLFPADACNAITGFDFGKRWRGKYHDEAGALEIIEKDFKGTIATPFYEFLGEPLRYPMQARRGDAVVFDIAGKPTAGVIDDTGRRVACVSLDNGLIRVPLRETMIVWSYG